MTWCRTGMVAPTCDPSTLKAQVGGLLQSGGHSATCIQANLGYKRRPCLQTSVIKNSYILDTLSFPFIALTQYLFHSIHSTNAL